MELTKKEVKKRKPAKNGKPFERKIANDLRQIYDPINLCMQINEAKGKEYFRLLKQSSVRRGEQGRGAHEPDVVTPTTWWLELQWASSASFDPMKKFNQALRDIKDHDGKKQWIRPVSICQRKHISKITVLLYLSDLITAVNDVSRETLIPSKIKNTIINIKYEDFLEILRIEKSLMKENT